MKKSISVFLFLFLTITLYSQCNFFVNDTLQTEKNKLNLRGIYAYNSISDVFDSHEAYVSVIGLVIATDKITVDITYRGGCGDYYFKLYEKYELIDGVPTVNLLPLVVNKCELIQLQTIYFDLKRIRAKYKMPFNLKIGRFESMIEK